MLYERTMRALRTKEYTSQLLSPPIILTLNMQEEELLHTYMDNFTALGFEIEAFGGRESAVRAVPDNLFSVASREVLTEMLDGLSSAGGNRVEAESINDRIATMSCKAAVKGNQPAVGQRGGGPDRRAADPGEPIQLSPWPADHCVHVPATSWTRKFKRIV